jgi:4'-phosphopantetheinyl transferase
MQEISFFSDESLSIEGIYMPVVPYFSPDFMAQLPADDQEAYQNIRHPHIQKEWLSSRMAVSILLKKKGLIYQGMEKDTHGKPFLKGTSLHFSITHTHHFVGAVVSPQNVGIDIEEVSEKLRTVAHKFLSHEEQQWSQLDLVQLTIRWAAKEALYKWKGTKGLISFGQHLHVPHFVVEPGPQIIAGEIRLEETKNYQIWVHQIDNSHWLAVAV